MRLNLINPKSYIHEFRHLARFVKKPQYTLADNLTPGQKAARTWRMFVVKFILFVMVGLVTGLLYDPQNKTTISMAVRFSTPVLFLITVLILPLLEEVAFRLSLRFKPLYLSLTLGTITYYIACKAIYHTKLTDVYEAFEERVLMAVSMVLLSALILFIPKVKNKVERFWEGNFQGIFYFFAIAFAWVHIFNYELTPEHLLLMPIITLPKLVNALCYGYTRMTYGFGYSMAIHMATNIVAFLVNL